MRLFQMIAGSAVVGLLAACAQQEEPVMVRPQPVFDKFGGGSCEGEWIYIPGSVPEFAECVPPEECEPTASTITAVIPCPPYNQPRNPNSDGSDDPARNPNSAGG